MSDGPCDCGTESSVYPFTSIPVTLILHVCLAALVFYHQRIIGRSGAGWTFVVLLLGVWGLVIYIIFNRDTLKLPAQRSRGRSLAERIGARDYDSAKARLDRSSLAQPPETIAAAPVFTDHQLERLMEARDLAGARSYLDNILRVAREMGDLETVEKYKSYNAALRELELSSQWLTRG
jgi:hypothetical protein